MPSISKSLCRVVAGLLVIVASACSETTSGDGLCSLLGPCATLSDNPVLVVVGFPAQRVANGEGRLSLGDTLSLYVVSVTRAETPCAARDTLHTAVQWAVSDTSVAEVKSESGGRGRILAKKAGTFGVVMYTPYTGQIPAGVPVNPIWVCPGVQPSVSAIRVL